VTGPSEHGARDDDARQPSRAPLPLDPRQRWRITFSRAAARGEEVPTGREYVARWEETLLHAGLPVLTLASERPRIALGAPLPSGCSGERELLEFWLTDVAPVWAVREGIERNLPEGHRLQRLENVWIGAPALGGQIAAADYVVTLAGGPDAELLAAAARRLTAARSLPRERLKSGATKTYDLRPLILTLDAVGATLRMRTRIHPELGTGRPDEVVAALADDLGEDLAIERIVRTCLLLADELER
jgi:radical SAM-linked protein